MALHREQQPIAQFKFPKFQLVWKPANEPRASWRLGLIGLYRRESPPRVHVVFAARGALAASGAAALAAYVSATAFVYSMWSASPQNRVSYWDLVIPFRWSEARELRGGDLIVEGLYETRRERYATGVLLLEQGIRLAPGDLRGRAELAKFYTRAGYINRAKQILEGGVAYPPISRSYYQQLFQVLDYLEEYQLTLGVIETLSKDAPWRTQRNLAAKKAQVLEKLQLWGDLDKLRSEYATNKLVEIELAWARSYLLRGNPQVALKEIAASPEFFGLPEERTALEIRLLIKAELFDDAIAKIAAWSAAKPNESRARFLMILAEAKAGRSALMRIAIEDYLLVFGGDPLGASRLLAYALQDLNEPEVRLIAEMATRVGAMSPTAEMAYVEALLSWGRFEEASDAFDALKPKLNHAGYGRWAEGIQLILSVCRTPTPSTQSQLLQFVSDFRASPAGYRLAINSLARSRASAVVADLVASAKNRFPAFEPPVPVTPSIGLALNSPIEASRRGGVQPIGQITNTTTPIRQRSPAPSMEKAAPAEASKALNVSTERAAKSALAVIDQQLTAKNYDVALSMVGEIERQGYASLQRDLNQRRVVILAGRGDLDQLVGACKLWFRDSNVDQTLVRATAERWSGENRYDQAIILLRAYLERNPGAKWANSMLQELLANTKTSAPR